jgi:hypothetical protein
MIVTTGTQNHFWTHSTLELHFVVTWLILHRSLVIGKGEQFFYPLIYPPRSLRFRLVQGRACWKPQAGNGSRGLAVGCGIVSFSFFTSLVRSRNIIPPSICSYSKKYRHFDLFVQRVGIIMHLLHPWPKEIHHVVDLRPASIPKKEKVENPYSVGSFRES